MSDSQIKIVQDSEGEAKIVISAFLKVIGVVLAGLLTAGVIALFGLWQSAAVDRQITKDFREAQMEANRKTEAKIDGINETVHRIDTRLYIVESKVDNAH